MNESVVIYAVGEPNKTENIITFNLNIELKQEKLYCVVTFGCISNHLFGM